jgi:hypothetical protein
MDYGLIPSAITRPLRSRLLRTDFADPASGYAGPEGRHSGGLVFTVGVCGRFLLVTEGGMIYIYELEGNNLKSLKSMVCPRRVLAMSMDASSRRFAITALLDGRMGFVCDLHLGHDSNGELSAASNGIDLDNGRIRRKTSNFSVFTSRLYQSGDRINAEERNIPMTSSQIASRVLMSTTPRFSILSTFRPALKASNFKIPATLVATNATISIELRISCYEGGFLHQQLPQALLPLHIATLKAYLLKQDLVAFIATYVLMTIHLVVYQSAHKDDAPHSVALQELSCIGLMLSRGKT